MRESTQKAMPLIFVGALIASIFLIFCIMAITTYEPPTAEELASERAHEAWKIEQKNKKLKVVVDMARMVLTLKDHGVVTDYKGNKVWVDRWLWSRFPKSDQELFMETYAKASPQLKEMGFSGCRIYDHITGKRIVWCFVNAAGEIKFYKN